jgi:hypothetical protein
MKFAAILAACAMALAVSTVHAEDIMPDILMQPAQSSVPGRAIDIRGLVPGMSIEEARAALAAVNGGAIRENTYTTSLSGKGQMVSSVPYIKWLSIGDDTDKLSAMFSGISSGNQLTLIKREADYRNNRDAAPLFDGFVDALVQKYGDPSFRKDGNEVTYLMWTYKDGQPAPCDPNGTPQCLEPESAFSYLPERAEVFDVVLSAKVGRQRGSDHALVFQLALTDLSIKASADVADEEGMRPALDAAIAQAAANAPTPSL